MKNAIKLAIEGGYFWKGEMNEKQKEKVIIILNEHWQEVVVDRDFWQALGKAMGWGNNGVSHAIFKYITSMDKPTKNRPLPPLEKDVYRYEVPAWAYHWHRFIDHLAEGKQIDDFFNDLLK